jgi:SAM-dependent methyltransferase
MSLLQRLLGRPRPQARPETPVSCPVCAAPTLVLDAVDFNKNCEEGRGLMLPKAGIDVEYVLCSACRFCFAPELHKWSVEDFEEKIYNADYKKVDPDYLALRPRSNATMLDGLFHGCRISHLDYGGGSGLLSRSLQTKGWKSRSYDPFVDRGARVADLGRFDLVTAFEVFEHVPDIAALFADLQLLLKPDGVLIFSTLLSDGKIAPGQPLDWWYAAPRNGHISLFSAESMWICMQKHGLNLSSASPNLHVAYREIPSWASPILRSA